MNVIRKIFDGGLTPSRDELPSTPWKSWTAICALSLLGGFVIATGAWWALTRSHDDDINSSAAMFSLMDTGGTLESEISGILLPAMKRTEILAKSPETIDALASGKSDVQTALLNSKITTATEVDAIALFDSAGRITAINTLYADGQQIAKVRIKRVLGIDMSQLPIIQRCLRNNSNAPVLEFQTHCTITPALFDSTGLSVAYSVPVINPQNGDKLGVISSRLRFERLSNLIEGHAIAGGSANAYFITDAGAYFSEAINSGREQAPVPVAELRKLVRPVLDDIVPKTVTRRADKYLAIFSLPGVKTLDGGSIHILIVADANWLARGPRQDRLIYASGAAIIGALLLILAGLIHARLAAKQSGRKLEQRVDARTAELQYANEALQRAGTDLQIAKDAAEAASRAKGVVFDTALDAIVTIDSRGIISDWNLQAETMFRWDRTEVVGMPLDEAIIPKHQWEAHRREIEEFVKTGEGPLLNKVAELVAIRRDGWEFPIELAITPAWSGSECTFTAFIRDITVRKQAELDLRQARDAAENATRAKSEFLANMSHEIRTPLNGVIGMSDLLLGTSLDEKQRRFAELIKSSGTSLADLINDILDFSKIEARKLEIDSVEFDLYAEVEDVMETMLIKATPRGLDLGCLTLPDVPRHVKGDPQRVKQILINLINNAIKFTESGSISTRLTVEHHSQECVTVRFAVTDTGIGIPADRMDRLFKSFSQVDASTTRNFGGTGLGLAISKQLAELMGGSIGVESRIGHGSTFWFTIKLGLTVENPKPAAAIDGRGLRVLAVQGDDAMRRILHDQLCSWQLEAAAASNGDEAMRMLKDAVTRGQPYDVAIINNELPDTGALELGRTIKTTPELAGTVLLIVLPWGSDFDPLKLSKAGFSNHLHKPVRQSRLYNSIMDAICSTSLPKRPSAPITPIIRSTPNPIVNGAPVARILIAEDNRVNQIVATEVLTKHGYACDIADNGNKAVAAAFTGRYDLVLMDCSMPGMDGIEATRQIRRAEKVDVVSPPRHLPIIALTANAIKGDRDLCLEAGMDDYVSKPLDPDRLIEAIQMLLAPPRPASATREVIEAPAPTSRAPSPIASDEVAPIAIDALLERCMDNVKTAALILDEFERQAVDDLAQIKQHVEGGDCAGLARAAHALKGASAILAADALAGIAFTFERMGRAGVLHEQDQLLVQLNVEIRRCIDYLPTARAAIAERTKV
jgi:PAS domain S-box-containing protein